MEQNDFHEIVQILNAAGASKDVIAQTLIQKGADQTTASQLAGRATRSKQLKRALPYLAVVLIASLLLYYALQGLGLVLALLLVIPLVNVLFFSDKSQN